MKNNNNKGWAIAEVVSGEGRFTDYVRVVSVHATRSAAEAAFDPAKGHVYVAPVKGVSGFSIMLSLHSSDGQEVVQTAEQ